MKRLLLFVAFLLVLGIQALPQHLVVATHAVLGELAAVVGGEAVIVSTIIPSGFCPGHYDLSPGNLASLLEADLVIYSGIEPWVEQLGEHTQANALAQLPGPWNSPSAAAAQLNAIAELLSDRMPEHAEAIQSRRDAYLDSLTALESELLSRAEEVGTAGIPVLCMQWQSGFVSWLGFEIAESFAPPSTLSLRDLIALANQGVEASAQVVIDNLQSGIEFGAKLAREVGAVHAVLTNFPGALPQTASLLDMLRRNAEALFSAIEPIG